MTTRSDIWLITGIMASGKSTVAQALAERLPKSVHLHGDYFRTMIVNGRAEMTTGLSAEAFAQLRLRYRLASLAAEQYGQAGFTVVYQDVIVGAILGEVVALYRARPLRVVVLCPSPEAVAQREAERGKTGYGGGWTPAQMDRLLREETPHLGLWLDSSNLSGEQTVDAIFVNLAHTRDGL